jgi:hypothetical protein
VSQCLFKPMQAHPPTPFTIVPTTSNNRITTSRRFTGSSYYATSSKCWGSTTPRVLDVILSQWPTAAHKQDGNSRGRGRWSINHARTGWADTSRRHRARMMFRCVFCCPRLRTPSRG